ncbi:AAA family ATPase [Sorangium sp. So ce1182]|uniref:AAA family ATPase n=1 Tax=Sorangium sp. So ce1182 TaxID=3133334 RepID=UPI003F5DFEF2
MGGEARKREGIARRARGAAAASLLAVSLGYPIGGVTAAAVTPDAAEAAAATGDGGAPCRDTAAGARRGRVEQLVAAARLSPHGSAEASALLGQVMGELRALQPEIEAGFREAATPPGVERLTCALDDEEQLDAARVLILSRLPEGARDEALGLGRAGIGQLRAELFRIDARARWYRLHRDSAAQESRAALRDPFVVTALAYRAALVVAVIAVASIVTRRRRRWMDAAWPLILRVVRRARAQRFLEGARSILATFSGSLLLLATIWGVHRALGPDAAAVREVELAYEMLLWYALYRLALAGMHGWIARRPSDLGAPIGEATSRKVLRSLRAVGRFALAVGLLVAAVEAATGRGYLYNAALRAASLGALLLGWVLIRWWRGDISDAYLRRHDEGTLASAVRKTRVRWYGFFVAVVALLALVLARVGRAARRALLGFDLTHRVLAFIFRKRLERRADSAHPDGLAQELPQDLRAHLSEEPLLDPTAGLDHHAGLDRFKASLAAWKESRRIGSLLLVGGAGSGKTTWLVAAEREAAPVPVVRVALDRRQLTAADVIATLGGALDAPPEARAGVEAFAAWLLLQPRRLLVLDDLEHLFLRGLEAWGAWEAFLEIIERSAPSTFWLCAIADHPYRYLVFARGGATVFRTIVRLAPWSEQRLAELLAARTRASGYSVSYEDLVMDNDESVDRAQRELRTERDFARLLWDYAQGCPRVALHFWQRSLLVDDARGERRLRVRLFRTPDEDELESLSEVERFVLASVVWHDSLTTDEAARSLGVDALPCQDALAKMVELGIIDDLRGRHRVTTRWQRAVSDYLVRKHLIQP